MELIINADEVDVSLLEKIRKNYTGKEVKITVDEVSDLERTVGKNNWESMQQMLKKYPPVVVHEDINIYKLIAESHG